MATQELNIEKARFDTRLPKEQKAFFERAARLACDTHALQVCAVTSWVGLAIVTSSTHETNDETAYPA